MIAGLLLTIAGYGALPLAEMLARLLAAGLADRDRRPSPGWAWRSTWSTPRPT